MHSPGGKWGRWLVPFLTLSEGGAPHQHLTVSPWFASVSNLAPGSLRRESSPRTALFGSQAISIHVILLSPR